MARTLARTLASPVLAHPGHWLGLARLEDTQDPVQSGQPEACVIPLGPFSKTAPSGGLCITTLDIMLSGLVYVKNTIQNNNNNVFSLIL